MAKETLIKKVEGERYERPSLVPARIFKSFESGFQCSGPRGLQKGRGGGFGLAPGGEKYDLLHLIQLNLTV